MYAKLLENPHLSFSENETPKAKPKTIKRRNLVHPDFKPVLDGSSSFDDDSDSDARCRSGKSFTILNVNFCLF